MPKKVIVDLGVHKGEDTAFYLKKGFSVIGVEASQKLFLHCFERFQLEIQKQDCKLFNLAIANEDDKEITFYESAQELWGTIMRDFDNRNHLLGVPSIEKMVKSIRLDTLLNRELNETDRFTYLKIDIEGADVIALKQVENLKIKPEFISIEAEKISWKKLLNEFKTFELLGYSKFKIIDQTKVYQQKVPTPSVEVENIEFKYEAGSSGLFGHDLPGEWLTTKQAIRKFKRIFISYKLFGDMGIFRRCRLFFYFLKAFHLKYPHPAWFDTHARLG